MKPSGTKWIKKDLMDYEDPDPEEDFEGYPVLPSAKKLADRIYQFLKEENLSDANINIEADGDRYSQIVSILAARPMTKEENEIAWTEYRKQVEQLEIDKQQKKKDKEEKKKQRELDQLKKLQEKYEK